MDIQVNLLNQPGRGWLGESNTKFYTDRNLRLKKMICLGHFFFNLNPHSIGTSTFMLHLKYIETNYIFKGVKLAKQKYTIEKVENV